ncbi:MAG: ABC transporter ATP-binding protein [Actinomycetota bacterium]
MSASLGAPPPTPALVCEDLHRSFGATRALNGFSMSLPPGEVIALVGPNGSGKTTLLLILSGLLAPDGGSARIGGVDPVQHPFEVHSFVGWMPDFFGTYDDLTSLEYLELFGAAYKLPVAQSTRRAHELLAMVSLSDKSAAPVHTLSRGQKQKLGFARTLVHSPRILLLDEPASGLDPRARIELRDLVRRQRDEGVTIVVSSHILTELEEMSDLVAFVDAGQCRGVHALSSLPHGGAVRRYRIRALNDVEAPLRALGVLFERVSPKRVVIETINDEAAADILARLVAQGVRVIEMTPVGGGLEGAFLAMEQEGRA